MRGRLSLALAIALAGTAALSPTAVGAQASATAAQAAQQPAKPQPDTASPLQRGKAVFDQWCAACHAPGPRHPGTQALDALYKGTKPGALEQRTDLVPALTGTFVRKGVSVMAPYRKTEISDADLAALAAYLAPKTR
jgi:mono/diheme cytochrome c family protein